MPRIVWVQQRMHRTDMQFALNGTHWVCRHFHLDHCGALPFFSEMRGYDGPIFMTYPTKVGSVYDLFSLLLFFIEWQPSIHVRSAVLRVNFSKSPEPFLLIEYVNLRLVYFRMQPL